MTGPRDLGRQLELFTALISHPGYRPEAVARAKNLMEIALNAGDYAPADVLAANLPEMLHGDDHRWAVVPSRMRLTSTKPSDLADMLDDALKAGALEVTIVGDVAVDQAITEVARTLATLPARADPLPEPATSPTLRPPSGGPPIVLTHKGRPDQAIAYIEWPTNDFYANPHESHVVVIAAGILQNRLIDRVRVTEGATYAPGAESNSSSELLGFGYLQASVEIPPAKIEGFYRDVDAIVSDLGRNPPTADEVLRARAPLVDAETRARETLDFWSYFLAKSQADPRELDAIRRKIPDYNSVTAAEITAVCRKYLTAERAWKVIVRRAAD
ncbi:MAG TPA: insulinase family protein, partial [Caulobacteraceae bacterium]|nr:insulinase family protein [Caulobacteraceae bacterium]